MLTVVARAPPSVPSAKAVPRMEIACRSRALGGPVWHHPAGMASGTETKLMWTVVVVTVRHVKRGALAHLHRTAHPMCARVAPVLLPRASTDSGTMTSPAQIVVVAATWWCTTARTRRALLAKDAALPQTAIQTCASWMVALARVWQLLATTANRMEASPRSTVAVHVRSVLMARSAPILLIASLASVRTMSVRHQAVATMSEMASSLEWTVALLVAQAVQQAAHAAHLLTVPVGCVITVLA